jgi:hypothetical protein
MGKTLLYRLCGAGKIPVAFREQVRAEGIVLAEEGIRCAAHFYDFRAPGRYSSRAIQLFSGAIVLTHDRLWAFRGGKPIISVPLDDERIHALQYVTGPNKLEIAFDAGLFNEAWSGRLRYTFSTPVAEQFLTHLIEGTPKLRLVADL